MRRSWLIAERQKDFPMKRNGRAPRRQGQKSALFKVGSAPTLWSRLGPALRPRPAVPGETPLSPYGTDISLRLEVRHL